MDLLDSLQPLHAIAALFGLAPWRVASGRVLKSRLLRVHCFLFTVSLASANAVAVHFAPPGQNTHHTWTAHVTRFLQTVSESVLFAWSHASAAWRQDDDIRALLEIRTLGRALGVEARECGRLKWAASLAIPALLFAYCGGHCHYLTTVRRPSAAHLVAVVLWTLVGVSNFVALTRFGGVVLALCRLQAAFGGRFDAVGRAPRRWDAALATTAALCRGHRRLAAAIARFARRNGFLCLAVAFNCFVNLLHVSYLVVYFYHSGGGVEQEGITLGNLYRPLVYFGGVQWVVLMVFVVPCCLLDNQTRRLCSRVSQLQTELRDKDLQNLMRRFSRQLLHHNTEMSAAGLFPIDATLVFTVKMEYYNTELDIKEEPFDNHDYQTNNLEEQRTNMNWCDQDASDARILKSEMIRELCIKEVMNAQEFPDACEELRLKTEPNIEQEQEYHASDFELGYRHIPKEEEIFVKYGIDIGKDNLIKFGLICNKEDFLLTPKQQVDDKNEADKKPNHCKKINDCFQHNSKKKKKTNTIIVDKRYECDLCERTYKYKKGLERHKVLTHFMNTKYSCNICNITLCNKYLLSKHIATHSKSTKSHICDICNKSFAENRCLTRHILAKHPKCPPSHVCDICNKSFTEKHRLTRHILTSHPKNPPSHTCNFCDKSFAEKSGLKKHKVIHSTVRPTYLCNVCNISVTSKYIFADHMLIHSAERPVFPCNVCNKSYRQRGGLNKHKVFHSNKRPSFTCDLCKVVFFKKYQLKSHIIRKTCTKTSLLSRNICKNDDDIEL